MENKKLIVEIAKSVGEIQTIFDCGARDAADGIDLMNKLGANSLHAFECNPIAIEKCKINLEKARVENPRQQFTLCECAVADRVGKIEFYPINTLKSKTKHEDGNIGASSLLISNGNYKKETYVQDKIEVESTTIDDYCKIKKCQPDLLWLDLQGAELLALKGAYKTLSAVKIVHVEVGFRSMYTNQALFHQINTFLNDVGFRLETLSGTRWPKLPKLYSILGIGPWVCNAIYIKH